MCAAKVSAFGCLISPLVPSQRHSGGPGIKHLVLSAAVGAAMLVGAAAPSQAVPYGVEPTPLGAFGFATHGLAAVELFTNANVSQSPAGFTNTFQFELTSVALTEFASATNNEPLITGLTVQIFLALAEGSATNVGGAIGLATPGDGAGGPDPTSQQASQSAGGALAPGFYNVVVTGIAPVGAAVSYAGVLNLTFEDLGIPQVPIPGAAWLFASGLVGILVLSRTRRKTQTPRA